MFKCDKCGECCRHLDESELYQEIDRGDGVCKFLTDNLCSIYAVSYTHLSRLVTVATAQSQSAALSWQSDVSAWNKYFGLYEAQERRSPCPSAAKSA